MLETIRLIISGKVQGVFYRRGTKEKADALGITGTVRNLDDGRVEVIATGNETALQQLKYWCREGPPRAVVHQLFEEKMRTETFGSFKIVH